MKNNKKQHHIKRAKRSNDRTAKKNYCTGLEIGSRLSEHTTDTANVLTQAAGSLNIFGIPVGAVVAAPSASISISAYQTKLIADLAYITNDCDSIPFDELKDAIDRNYDAIQSIKKLLEKLPIRQSKIADVTSRLTTFIDTFIQKRATINQFTEDQLIIKLESSSGIFNQLKTDTISLSSNSLHLLINNIIQQQFAIPENAQDEIAFIALGLLCAGVETYFEVMNFLLQGHAYLANHYHQQSNIEKYNQYYHSYTILFKEFTPHLNGLIDKTVQILSHVKALNFVQNERETVLEFTSKKINYLKEIKSKLDTINRLPQVKPTKTIKYDFSNSSITTPITQWKDGHRVSYALQYKDNVTYSQVGEWSNFYTLLGKANPYLDIDIAPKNITRLIFRTFDNHKPELVGIVENSDQRHFRDIDRDLYNAASEANQEIAKKDIEFFIQHGANIYARFEQGRQVIHRAAQYGSIEKVLMFIDYGANINATDFNAYTPLHIAARLGDAGFIQRLLNLNANLHAKLLEGDMPIDIATLKGHVNAVKLFIEKDSRFEELGSLDELPIIIGIEFLDNSEKTKLEILKYFIDEKQINFNPNKTYTRNEYTLLHIVAMEGYLAATKYLVQSEKIEVNVRDKNGNTPLHLAASNAEPAIVEYLLKVKNIDVNAKNKFGNTPLQNSICITCNDIAKNETTQYSNSMETRSLYLGLDQKLFGRYEASCKARELLEYLQNQPSDKIQKEFSPLVVYSPRCLSDKEFDHNMSDKNTLNIVTHLLLQHKRIDVNIQNNEGDTALHLAAIDGYLSLTKDLIKKGANTTIRNNDGYTPLEKAIAYSRSSNILFFRVGEDLNGTINYLQSKHTHSRFRRNTVQKYLPKKTNVTQTVFWPQKPQLIETHSAEFRLAHVREETEIENKNVTAFSVNTTLIIVDFLARFFTKGTAPKINLSSADQYKQEKLNNIERLLNETETKYKAMSAR